jgi:hypothetical protein
VGADVRVIELENVLPSRMHLARLLPDGSVAKGTWLNGYYTSEPALLADGTALFFRHGALLAARDLAIDARLELAAPDDGNLCTSIVTGDRSAFFALRRWQDDGLRRLVRVD